MAQHSPTAGQPRRDVVDWENEGAHHAQADDLEPLGITRTLIEAFTVGPYRYTNRADAIAQARRMKVGGQ